ncbi:ADR272Wp [Eremothecium gossypii ATCC 10895]|uniref:ADR272Wp n=1 Tax=Eremothecium gossypii (strain ATCC 10895 / CBS 109.51 / FGSC 9923 / NRRL Y-1056) TaxID=284811 RepID=Q759K5_EREGS|nr:ADR272Wp [Eremothecium gossypii ATCC 10895]AAS52192.1 ADR272Wp [Eremothecium gossypii ATCC 10895]AEY96491.1 FADR272Wp [Eremothecium gossypii FDAG1]
MSSLFSQNSSDSNRFTNLSIKFPQQQQTISQQQGSNLQPQSSQQAAIASQGQFVPNEEKPPRWFNNPRKRTIPQNIIKRSSKPTSSEGPTPAPSSGNSSSTSHSGFGSVTFGSKKSNIFNTRANTQGHDMMTPGNVIDSNEAPPTKSLYDLQREDEFGSVIPSGVGEQRQQPLALAKSKDATLMRNVFDRELEPKKVKKDDQSASASASHNESAVLVFGYPESISNQVILHFSKFGNILEDFEVLRGVSGMRPTAMKVSGRQHTENRKKYPIFTGDGWIKLTYDSPSSALRALQENGTVYGGCLVGCVPYSKQAVEQLASCHIEKADDIGGVNFSVAQTPNNSLNAGHPNGDDQPVPGSREDDHARFTFSTRMLDIKDGKSLLVHNGNAHNQNFLKNLEDKMRHHDAHTQANKGVLSKVNNWLFGWNEL